MASGGKISYHGLINLYPSSLYIFSNGKHAHLLQVCTIVCHFLTAFMSRTTQKGNLREALHSNSNLYSRLLNLTLQLWNHMKTEFWSEALCGDWFWRFRDEKFHLSNTQRVISPQEDWAYLFVGSFRRRESRTADMDCWSAFLFS